MSTTWGEQWRGDALWSDGQRLCRASEGVMTQVEVVMVRSECAHCADGRRPHLRVWLRGDGQSEALG